MAKQTPEQRRESLRQAGIRSSTGRPRYPKGHPLAGRYLPRGTEPPAPPDPAQPPADPPPQPPAAPPADPPPAPPATPPVGRVNPLTMTPRDVFDRIRSRGQ